MSRVRRDRGGDRPKRPSPVRPVLVEDVLDGRADGELQREPDEHRQHDRADTTIISRRSRAHDDPGEDRDEVDELEGELAHHRRHRQADHEHVGGGQRGHDERPAAPTDQQRGPGDHGERLNAQTGTSVWSSAPDAADQLEGDQADHGDRGGEEHVLATHGRAGPLPGVVDAEEGFHPGRQAREAGDGSTGTA